MTRTFLRPPLDRLRGEVGVFVRGLDVSRSLKVRMMLAMAEAMRKKTAKTAMAATTRIMMGTTMTNRPASTAKRVTQEGCLWMRA